MGWECLTGIIMLKITNSNLLNLSLKNLVNYSKRVKTPLYDNLKNPFFRCLFTGSDKIV